MVIIMMNHQNALRKWGIGESEYKKAAEFLLKNGCNEFVYDYPNRNAIRAVLEVIRCGDISAEEAHPTVLSERKASRNEAREAFYARIRSNEQKRYEKVLEILRSDEKYMKLAKERCDLDAQFAALPSEGEQDACSGSWLMAAANLRQKMNERMGQLGLFPNDDRKKYRCKECHDTGELPDGKLCDCWKRSVKSGR